MTVQESDVTFAVGDRVEDIKDYQRGTVRFVGEVPPTRGLWLGVEWDHPEIRGKHDGTHEGVKYFETFNRDNHPAPASFVRPAKVTRGISIPEAVVGRYGAVEGDTAGVDEQELGRLCREIGAPFVTVVGFDKVNKQQSDFAKLRTVSLRRCSVSNLGSDPDQLGTMLARVQNLDLGENLFNSWTMLAEIGRQLKNLRVFTVSDNRLELPPNPDVEIVPAFVKLEQLVVGELDYDWSEIFSIASGLPILQLLHCHSNRICEISGFRDKEAFHNLIELNLNGNPLVKWSNVMKFAHLPNLKKIYINDCKIKSIEFDPDLDEKDCFPSLRGLCMTHNEINDWLSFARLDRLKLTDLRCRANPIMESEAAINARQILIASISSLEILNGTGIERTERYGADIDYLKRYGLEYWAAVKQDNLEAFRQSHPRYMTLVGKYGVIEEEELKEKDTSLKATLLSVVIDCPLIENFEKISKKLPQTMTVQKLRLLVQRALNRKLSGAMAHKLVMTVSSTKNPEVQVPLDNDMRDLFFYSVENGDTIYVKW